MVRRFEALYESAPRMSRLGNVAVSGAAPRL